MTHRYFEAPATQYLAQERAAQKMMAVEVGKIVHEAIIERGATVEQMGDEIVITEKKK